MAGTSIEKRLRLLIMGGVGTVLLAACLLLQYMVEKRLTGEYDRALAAKAEALVTLTKQFGSEVELDFADEFMPEFSAPENPEYFQLWLGDASVLERSRSLRRADLPRGGGGQSGRWYSNLMLPDGRKGRSVEITFLAQIEDKEGMPPHTLPQQQKVTLVVARERESLAASLRNLRLSLLLAIAVMTGLITVTVRSAVGVGLKPLRELGAQLQSLDAGRLDSRLDIKAPPRELVSLIEQFNELLERLQKSFQREQRFSADVAHELRTPVAELRNLSEIAVRWPEDRRLLEKFFQDVLDISLKMQGVIHNLLALARCEQGKTGTDFRETDMAELIGAAWLRVAQEARQRRITFQKSDLECRCLTGVQEMELILNNLFSNAVAHGMPGTEIRASIKRSEADASLTLDNIVANLSRSDLDLMFDRLWRKDPARAGERHAGLGLSLVRAYAGMLDLTVTVDLDDAGRFSITLSGLRLNRDER